MLQEFIIHSDHARPSPTAGDHGPVADEISGTTPITLPTAPCEQSLAQQLAVAGSSDRVFTNWHLSVSTSTVMLPAPSASATTDMSSAIDATMSDFMNQYGMAGGALAITFNNQLIFAKAYGYADADNAVFAEPDSRFRIASVSKAITAMGILKLVHDGQLSYPLNQHPFPFGSTDLGGGMIPSSAPYQPWLSQITIDELLHHHGGWGEDYKDYPTLETVEHDLSKSPTGPPDCTTLLRWVEARKMTSSDFAPGGSHAPEYSNIGFCALSEVIRKTSGESYSDYIQANMLGPLGMNDTALGFTQRSKQQDREVVYYPCGYSPDKPGPRPTGFCGYGVDSSAILGPSLFPADGTTSAAYGGGTSTYSPEASKRAERGPFRRRSIWRISPAPSPAESSPNPFSGPLPERRITLPGGGWPAKYYEYSTEIPPYETNSCSGWFGMGWDTVQSCTGLPASFLPYDNFNFFKGGGTPGTTSGVWATADGYGLAVVVNGDIGKFITVLRRSVAGAANAAVCLYARA